MLAPLMALLGVASCGDAGPTRPLFAPEIRDSPHFTALQDDLDAKIRTLIVDLFPQGLETATGARWNSITTKVAAGAMSEAQTKLDELSRFMVGKQSTVTPPAGETAEFAVARLILYMSAYVGVQAPVLPTGVDAVVAVVLPGTNPAPIVTPSKRAGVDLDTLSVNVPTVITVIENTQPYPAQCAGPLTTTLCQYPEFYKFDAIPHVRLNVPADFAVCLVKRTPWSSEIDGQLRLAHDRPATPDITPGATQYEGIEILPLITVSFLECEPHTEPPVAQAGPFARAGYALLDAVASVLTPRNAWAVDLGGGGESQSFSNFNVVQLPSTVTLSGITMSACNALQLGYTVNGVSTEPTSHTKPAGCASASVPQVFPALSFQVPSGGTTTVYLRDVTCGVVFSETSNHALVTPQGSGQRIAITDGGAPCPTVPVSRVPTPADSGNLILTRTRASATP